MKILIKIILICGMLFATAHAETASTQVVGATGKTAAKPAEDRDAVCTRCHDETETKPLLSIYQSAHGNRADARTPSCQQCHGQSDAHLKGDPNQKGRAAPDIVYGTKNKTYEATPAVTQNDKCIGCHESGLRTHWSGSQHEMQGVTCSNCHTSHVPKDKVLEKISQPDVCFTCHKTQRAEIHLFSVHPILVGKTACSECHNAHGSTGPKMLIKQSTNETCYTCHAEKRGPFLWEHSPVVDDCTNCHTSHGSNNPPLLKQRTPWLCQECHTADHAQTVDSGANLINGDVTTINGRQSFNNLSPRAQANGLNCLSCHSMIHGSNHPAGAKFNR